MMVTEELRKDGYRNVGPIVDGDVGKYVVWPSEGVYADLELKVLDPSIEFKISSPASAFVPAYSAGGRCEINSDTRIGLRIVRGVNNFFFGRALYQALAVRHVLAETPPTGCVDKLVWTIAGKTVTIDLSDPGIAMADFDGADRFKIPWDANGAAESLVKKLVLPRDPLQSILDRLDKIACNS